MSKTKIYTGAVLVLGIVQFIESIAFSIPSSYYPNYIIELGASVASIGLFTSGFMMAEAIMAPKMGGFQMSMVGGGSSYWVSLETSSLVL